MFFFFSCSVSLVCDHLIRRVWLTEYVTHSAFSEMAVALYLYNRLYSYCLKTWKKKTLSVLNGVHAQFTGRNKLSSNSVHKCTRQKGSYHPKKLHLLSKQELKVLCKTYPSVVQFVAICLLMAARSFFSSFIESCGGGRSGNNRTFLTETTSLQRNLAAITRIRRTREALWCTQKVLQQRFLYRVAIWYSGAFLSRMSAITVYRLNKWCKHTSWTAELCRKWHEYSRIKKQVLHGNDHVRTTRNSRRNITDLDRGSRGEGDIEMI